MLLWWSWVAYVWLGNRVRTDQGLVRAGMLVVMAALFIAALVMPDAWSRRTGTVDAPPILAADPLAYRVARAHGPVSPMPGPAHCSAAIVARESRRGSRSRACPPTFSVRNSAGASGGSARNSTKASSPAPSCWTRPPGAGPWPRRPRFHSLLKGARKSFAWQDYLSTGQTG
ncbi:low temperature requirement protein A [Streptomyces sp. NBC_01450]|uniref:low temperature requirement protein A n=1 Tax=Streptomyces sp. NBC_01450 TaxID=2903871 RepID=UPI003FCCACD5